jgi:hypothetical protein
MDQLGPAWNAVKDNLVPYALYVLVFTLVVTFTAGLGALALTPNYFRGYRKALAGNTGPDIADLFNFDHIADDVVTMLLAGIAVFVGLMLCVIPGLILAILFFWVPLLAASRSYEPVDALKASLYAVKSDPIPPVIFGLVMGITTSIAANIFFLPYLVAAPVFIAAQTLWFNQTHDEIKQLAAAAGVNARV